MPLKGRDGFYLICIRIFTLQILCLTAGDRYGKIIYGKKVKIMVFSQKVKIALNVVKLLSGLEESEVMEVNDCACKLGVSPR